MMLKEQGKEFFRVATNSNITDEQVVESGGSDCYYEA